MTTPKNEYNFPKYEDYNDCVVAFVDILGFDSRVRNIQSVEEFSEIGKLLYAITETAANFNKDQKIFQALNITAISDSIILSMPYNDPVCTMALITILHQSQYDILVGYGTILRGYITRGPVYHKNEIIFGKGYSEAYIKEQEVGHAPRIVIDPKLIEDAWQKISNYKGKDKIDHIFNYVKEDSSDGYFFIDYFKPVGMLSLLPKEDLVSERVQLQEFVKAKLKEFKANEKILRKYKWLENYLSISKESFEEIIKV